MPEITVYNRYNQDQWTKQIKVLGAQITYIEKKVKRLQSEIITYRAVLLRQDMDEEEAIEETEVSFQVQSIEEISPSDNPDEPDTESDISSEQETVEEHSMDDESSAADFTDDNMDEDASDAMDEEKLDDAQILFAVKPGTAVAITVDFFKADIEKLHQQLTTFDDRIDEQLQYKEKFNDEIRRCQYLINHCKKFLADMHQHPQQFFTQQFVQVLTAIEDYQFQTPHQQRQEERCFWGDIFQKLAWVRTYSEEDTEVTFSISRDHLRFGLLCGLLWDMKYRLALFAEQGHSVNFDIDALLQNTHIGEQGSLPDELAFPAHPGVPVTCRQLYQVCRPKTANFSLTDLLQHELEIYNAALSALEHNSSGELTHVDKALAVVTEVKKQVKKDAQPDYRFYALLLKIVYGSLKSSPDENAVMYLKKYIDIAPGAPSVWGFITPILFVLSGALDVVGVTAYCAAPAFFKDHAGKFAASTTVLKAVSLFSYNMLNKRQEVSKSLYDTAATVDPTMDKPCLHYSYERR